MMSKLNTVKTNVISPENCVSIQLQIIKNMAAFRELWGKCETNKKVPPTCVDITDHIPTKRVPSSESIESPHVKS